MRVWDVDAAIRGTTAPEHSRPVIGVEFSPDGRRLISLSSGVAGANLAAGELKLWDPDTGREIATLDRYKYNIMSIGQCIKSAAFTDDGRHVVCKQGPSGQPTVPVAGPSGDGETLRFFDVETGAPADAGSSALSGLLAVRSAVNPETTLSQSETVILVRDMSNGSTMAFGTRAQPRSVARGTRSRIAAGDSAGYVYILDLQNHNV